jgi:hypothetical protein
MEPVLDKLGDGMIIVRFSLIFIIAGLCACSPQMKRVDIDAGGYDSGPVTGRELLNAAMSHAIRASSAVIGMEMAIQNADLPEKEKVQIRQRVDYLLNIISESTLMAGIYLDPIFSEAERRQVFRAIEDRIEEATVELRSIRFSMWRAAKANEATTHEQK